MSFSVFRGMVSWASLRANPQAYGPLGSTHCDPRGTSWAVEAAARAASFPIRAGRDRTSENVVLPPRRV